MSKPRYKWWGYVKFCIRDYPDKREELAIMRSAKPSDGMPRSKEPTRTTENAALTGFQGWRGVEYNGVYEAIEETKRQMNGNTILRIIDLVFWRQSHTLQGAAAEAHVAYDTAAKYHGDFIRLVAKKMGLLDETYIKKP